MKSLHGQDGSKHGRPYPQRLVVELESRQKEILHNDGHKLLPPDDPRSRQVARVTTRLITALEEGDRHIVYGANWPPKSQELSRVISEREALIGGEDRYYPPSGTAKSTYVPYRPPTRNPLKQFESPDWRLYVIDSVSP